jgi:hypothetical protein
MRFCIVIASVVNGIVVVDATSGEATGSLAMRHCDSNRPLSLWFAVQNVTVMTTLSLKVPAAGTDCVGTRP